MNFSHVSLICTNITSLFSYMKKSNLYWLVAFFTFILPGCSNKNVDLDKIINERVNASQISLIPDNAGSTPSYFCTWSAQNFAVDTITLNYMIGLGDHTMASDKLTEDAVFGNRGWEKQFPGSIKKDLFLMFDVGWDIAGESFTDKKNKWIIGTLDVATDKFPSCTGTPEEKLAKLNLLTKNAGWKGAGIWIAAQTSMDSKGIKPSDEEVEKYYRERFIWSRKAGIQYWKVDYGSRGGDLKYRQMLTRLSHEEAPGLLVEHGRGGGPFNDDECPWDAKPQKTGRYSIWDNGNALKSAHNLLEFSDVLRTYDVSAQLSIPTTLDRVAQILNTFNSMPLGRGIINCEDEPYIAAALGCAVGIMRHPAFINAPGHDYDPLKVKNQMDAVIRAVRWQRFSPAFSVGSNITELDTVINKDYWTFKPGQTWAKWMEGKTILQAAPSRVARGMHLPDVKCDGISPYVVCSRFPNGNYAVSSLIRTDSIKGFIYPLADVVLNCSEIASVGIFGRFKSLTIVFESPTKINKVIAQDLAGEKAIDITDLIHINQNSVKLSGELLKIVGLSAASKNDVSAPGLVLAFK